MASSKEKPLDNPTFEACQEALAAALATVQQWRPGGEVDPHLKAKLALLIIKHAAKGETSPAILRKRALANYFLKSACEESDLNSSSGYGISKSHQGRTWFQGGLTNLTEARYSGRCRGAIVNTTRVH